MWEFVLALVLSFPQHYCNALSNYTCKCGWRNIPDQIRVPKIAHGGEVLSNEFPMAAFLTVRGTRCGATIITERHALTAAHCVDVYSPRQIILWVGKHTVGGSEQSRKKYYIARIYADHYVNDGKYANDIAILLTKRKIRFSGLIGPACLPNGKFELDYQRGIALGWGKTEEGIKSPVLKKAKIRIISPEKCSEQYNVSLPDYGAVLCGKSGTFDDICQGDSGGPLLWVDPDTRRLTLVGVVSHSFNGQLCPSPLPNVYTDVSSYIDWINSVIEHSTRHPIIACAKVSKLIEESECSNEL